MKELLCIKELDLTEGFTQKDVLSQYKNELTTVEGCVPLKGRRLTLRIADACRRVGPARDDHIEWIKAVSERQICFLSFTVPGF